MSQTTRPYSLKTSSSSVDYSLFFFFIVLAIKGVDLECTNRNRMSKPLPSAPTLMPFCAILEGKKMIIFLSWPLLPTVSKNDVLEFLSDVEPDAQIKDEKAKRSYRKIEKK